MTTLYKPTKLGSTQQWSIEVVGDSFICTYGQLDGKMQTQITKCEPKNIGRANETTPEQQAQLEADALIAKKIKSGYSYDSAAPTTVALAMKVKSYQDQLNNVRFPCYDSLKLNGINGIYRLENGVLNLYSRGGELYPEIPHHKEEVLTILNNIGTDELNGELYIHGVPLQDLISAVKVPQELSKLLEFHVFDVPNVKGTFKDRYEIMCLSIQKGTYETERWNH